MRRIGAWLLVAAILGAAGLSAGAASKKATYQKRLGSVSSKIKDVKHKIAVKKKEQKVVTSKLYTTQRRLNDTRSSIRYTRSRLAVARGQLRQINASLRQAEAKLLEKRTALTHRLTDAYQHPAPSYIAAVLTADDAWTALTRTKMVQKIVESDMHLLEDIRQQRAAIKQRQAVQKRKVAEIGSLQNHLYARAAEEKHLALQQHAQIKEIAADRAQYERALDDLIAESHRMTAMIRALQATPAGRQRAATVFRGRFIRPVSGRVTSSYGMRYHPVLHKYKLHTGVDFAAATGTSVRAAASGTVILSGWMGAYGNAVVIDHGGGVTTLYGHNSSLSVRVGQTVRQGQTIARAGSTGLSTGPHVHFEVRRNGQPVNPL